MFPNPRRYDYVHQRLSLQARLTTPRFSPGAFSARSHFNARPSTRYQVCICLSSVGCARSLTCSEVSLWQSDYGVLPHHQKDVRACMCIPAMYLDPGKTRLATSGGHLQHATSYCTTTKQVRPIRSSKLESQLVVVPVPGRCDCLLCWKSQTKWELPWYVQSRLPSRENYSKYPNILTRT